MKINDFKHKPSYTTLINTRLVNYLLDFLYKPLWKIINSNIKAENDNNLILDALRRGDIFYQDGVFRAVNKFSNSLSIEFKKLGAKYNKNLKGFQFQEMPKFLRDFVALQEVRTQIKLEQLNGYLDDLQYNLDHYVDTMVFNHDVDKILGDVNKQIGKNVKNINVIEPELSREQLNEIGNNYTNNMKLYVKKWTNNRIVDLRQKVQQYVLEGFREEKISKLLLDEYEDELKKSIKKPKIPKSLTEFEVKKLLKLEKERIKKKAKFLAQNETSIMLAQYKKQVYTEMGFTEFKWNTIMDGRERQNHADLNGKIFRFDTPPIIDERTGQRGLPGETYNCRCGLTPINRDSVFNGLSAQNWLKSNFDESRIHRNKGKFSKNLNTFVENLEPIIINSNEIKQFKSKDRNKLSQYVLDLFQQNRHLTIKSNNREILLSNNSAKRTSAKQDVNDKKQNAFYLKIKEIIENAHYFDIEKADARHPNVEGQEIYYSKILIDNEPFKVKISVDIPLKKYLEKGATYNFAGHRVSKIELAPARKTLSANNSTGELQQVLIIL